jgi:hypothetical protein
MRNTAEITLSAKSPTLFLNMMMMVGDDDDDTNYNPGATVLLFETIKYTRTEFVLLNLYHANIKSFTRLTSLLFSGYTPHGVLSYDTTHYDRRKMMLHRQC